MQFDIEARDPFVLSILQCHVIWHVITKVVDLDVKTADQGKLNSALMTMLTT